MFIILGVNSDRIGVWLTGLWNNKWLYLADGVTILCYVLIVYLFLKHVGKKIEIRDKANYDEWQKNRSRFTPAQESPASQRAQSRTEIIWTDESNGASPQRKR